MKKKVTKDLLIECFICGSVEKYNSAHRKPIVKKDTTIVRYMCSKCKEKENE